MTMEHSDIYSPEDDSQLSKLQNTGARDVSTTPVIIAMGVGGGGGNAVHYMCTQNIQGVEFVALNTDRQALNECRVPTKLLLGPQLLKGRGAGGKAEKGAEAAEESVPEIERLLDRQVDMIFITAGMGGGTGTGAAPVVARVAKNKGILTIGIVTIPFFFEGTDKMQSALDGAEELKKNVDALLVINNDRLGDIYPTMAWSEAFSKADDILATAARSISDTVTTPGMINIDMNDVDSTLRDGRTAFISVGYGEGEDRMTKAMQNALHSPLLCDTDIFSAKHLLFAFYYSHDIEPEFTVAEATKANRLVNEMNKGVKIIFGWGYDDSLGNKIKFTILASGFDVTDGDGEPLLEKGNADDSRTPEVDGRIRKAYGDEKVNELERNQQTQNYFILTPAQLDSDEMIETLEKSPAYRRDKRAVARKNSERPGDNPNAIIFSPEDR